jgi:hypothetical protein
MESENEILACNYHAPYLSIHRVLDHAPLLTRGWVVQERLLSPRNVYFGGDELCWECCERGIAESWPYEDNPSTSGDVHVAAPLKVVFETVLQPITAQVPIPGRVDRDYSVFLDAWHKILSEYTNTDLTFESDRMVALSGIAGAVQHRTGLTYVAGIWKELEPHDLLWCTKTRIFLDQSRSHITKRPLSMACAVLVLGFPNRETGI